MSGLALKFDSRGGDLVVENGKLVTSDTLEAAIILSLFCDARAQADDEIPDNSGDPRGYWADTFNAAGEANFGSRLWLLNRAIQTSGNVQRAIEYAREALQWLVDDGVAKSVDVSGEVPRDEVLLLSIAITQPDGAAQSYRYFLNWQAQEEKVY